MQCYKIDDANRRLIINHVFFFFTFLSEWCSASGGLCMPHRSCMNHVKSPGGGVPSSSYGFVKPGNFYCPGSLKCCVKQSCTAEKGYCTTESTCNARYVVPGTPRRTYRYIIQRWDRYGCPRPHICCGLKRGKFIASTRTSRTSSSSSLDNTKMHVPWFSDCLSTSSPFEFWTDQRENGSSYYSIALHHVKLLDMMSICCMVIGQSKSRL